MKNFHLDSVQFIPVQSNHQIKIKVEKIVIRWHLRQMIY